jgi:hypothetical protein
VAVAQDIDRRRIERLTERELADLVEELTE